MIYCLQFFFFLMVMRTITEFRIIALRSYGITEYGVQSAEFRVCRNAEYRIYSVELRNTEYRIQSTEYRIQNYKVQSIEYRIQST